MPSLSLQNTNALSSRRTKELNSNPNKEGETQNFQDFTAATKPSGDTSVAVAGGAQGKTAKPAPTKNIFQETSQEMQTAKVKLMPGQQKKTEIATINSRGSNLRFCRLFISKPVFYTTICITKYTGKDQTVCNVVTG